MILIKVLTYLILFVLCYGISGVKIFGNNLMPFAVGIIFAYLIFKFNGYILSLIYFVTILLSQANLNTVFVGINVSCVLCLFQFLLDKQKIQRKTWIIFVFAIFSQIAYIIVNLGGTKENLGLFVSIVLSLFFLYSSLSFFEAISTRKNIARLNLDEKICGGVILIMFMYGMSATNIWIINLGFVFAGLMILISTYLMSAEKQIVLSSIIGIAIALQTWNQMYISLFVVLAILSISFKCNFKYLSIISMTLGGVLVPLFFGNGFSLGEFLSLLAGGVIFAIIPMGAINNMSNVFVNNNLITVKNIIDNSKKQIVKRTQELSKVFDEMDTVYRKMVRGTLPDDKAKIMIKEELVLGTCAKCKNFDYCYRTGGNFIDNSIDTCVSIAYEKGKILLIDVPQHLTSNCINVNSIITVLNNMITSYKEYTGVINNLDSSRLLIANQLSGVSKLMQTLSREVDVNINIDTKFDTAIREELGYKGVIVLNSFVYEKDIQNRFVGLLVSTDTINKIVIEKVVSKIMKTSLMIDTIEQSCNGTSVINMIPKPNYDIAYGLSSANKTGKIVSGDSNSILKLGNGKFMISICDGMGSGKNAHSISSLTISLIENFYKAGFDNVTIINSVNKLLSLTEEENFSTIDLCIIDANKNTYDFIKLGATSGYLKRDKGDVEVITSSGLPVGVLEEIHPHITRKLISPFDMLVFVSDGVTDSFEDKLDISDYIAHSDTINPVTLSQQILDKAISLNGGVACDDMTVVCVRVFKNV